MSVSEQVRRIYEKRPYPAGLSAASVNKWWRLPPMEWINAVWQPARPAPRRIMVAGCGTGFEAFALCRRFADAEVVAVDFSRRSIGAARRLQKRFRRGRRIRFLAGDLASRRLPEITGGEFDFISCHGVLSYIPQPLGALRNFKRCLRADGALYLGVNGSAHTSARVRRFLPAFGIDMAELRESANLRALLRLSDAVVGASGSMLAARGADYLAGDLFGPLIHNLPLEDWVELCRDAGLRFRGSYAALRTIRPVLNGDLQSTLMPRSRAEVCELLELLAPSTFHGLVFSPSPAASPPWKKPQRLLDWRPVATDLFVPRWPRRKRPWKRFVNLRVKSPATNTLVELCVPEWEVEILRQSSGKRSLRDILSEAAVEIAPESLVERLYFLYQVMLVNLLPPIPARAP